jgi:UDP-2,3-diacylglucosamine hydrolase
MNGYLQIASPEIFFLADSHFRNRKLPGEAERRDRFIRFLQSIPDGSALFLLGDIFDFYFEYASVVSKRYFDIFYALHACRTRKIELHFLGGNHDYWVGDFLDTDIGIRIHDDDLMIEAQGRKIRCTHGDLLIPDDRGYRTLRAILRNPVMIKIARWLHPDIMSAIARRVSRETKRRKRRTQEETANHLANIAKDSFYKWGNDVFVMGHVHYPIHWAHEGRDFVIVGDWIDSFSYARIHGGKLSVESFKS